MHPWSYFETLDESPSLLDQLSTKLCLTMIFLITC